MYQSDILEDGTIVNESGERIKELYGVKQGFTKQSLAEVTIPQGCSSLKHHHPDAEETYIFLRGRGKLVINGQEMNVGEDSIVGINIDDTHQIFNVQEADLVFLCVCSPAWETITTIYE